MKAHQSTHQPAQIKPSELFFGVLMLIIIFMTSCNTSHASPKVNMDASYIEQAQEVNASSIQSNGKEDGEIQRKQSHVLVPALVVLLLIFSYGVLSGSLYLIKEIKK